MKQVFHVLFLLISFGGLAQTLEDDKAALIAFYNAAGGGSWFNSYGWPHSIFESNNPCEWSGVGCENGRVTSLNLRNNHLTGSISPEIGKITELKILMLTRSEREYYSGLGGPIPSSLGNLQKLEILDLYGNNGLSGSIPSSLGNLTKLTYLDLSSAFVWPNLPAFGSLVGPIPAELGNLENLVYLSLTSKEINGNLPPELGKLKKLQTLALAGNKFTGTIPAAFGEMEELVNMNLSYIPPTAAWEVRGPRGELSGAIPAEFSKLSKLKSLDLSYQNLNSGLSATYHIPVSGGVSITGNAFTFDGIEGYTNIIDYYSPQAKIPMKGMFPLSSSVGVDGTLYVEAGGTISNNTYKWFKDNNLVATNVGVNSFNTTGLGTYQVQVTNSFAPDLTLVSEDYPVTILPVTLISFSGKNDADENHLTWKTTSETNNSGFEIERSADAKSFERIGFVDGNGDSKVVKNYNFTDSNPFSTTYYRLKQIDYDGQFEYSRIIAVKRNFSGISIYPNPARDQIFVRDLEKEAQIIVRNAEGKTLLTQMVYPKQAVELNNFSNGFYFITIGNEVRKVVIDR